MLELLDHYKLEFGPQLDFACVAEEEHADGSPHLHAFVRLKRPCDFNGAACLDLVVEGVRYHGNYQVARKPHEALKYCIKDKTLSWMGITEGEALAATKSAGKKRAIWDVIGEKIAAGQSAKQIVLADRSLYFHLKYIENAVAQEALWNMPIKPKFLGAFSNDLCYENMQIADWLMKNVGVARTFKQEQLYVHGPLGLGKTFLLNMLQECLNVYVAPYDGEWFDDYTDDYDLVVFDEFRSQYTIQFLNSFLEGSTKPLRRRGKGPYVKQKNVPVVFMSNYAPEEAYGKVTTEKLETLKIRLKIVNVTKNIRLTVKHEGNQPIAGPVSAEVVSGAPQLLSSSVLEESRSEIQEVVREAAVCDSVSETYVHETVDDSESQETDVRLRLPQSE